VVGVAGVAGTVWTAHSGRRHQVQITQAQGAVSLAVGLAAEKRLIYARFLQAADVALDEARALLAAGGGMGVNEGPLPVSPSGSAMTYVARHETGTPFDLALDKLSKIHKEVVISGGLKIGNCATEVILTIARYASESVDADAVYRTLMRTARVMHEDAMRPAGLDSSSDVDG
jgi:hypothetical protein